MGGFEAFSFGFGIEAMILWHRILGYIIDRYINISEL